MSSRGDLKVKDLAIVANGHGKNTIVRIYDIKGDLFHVRAVARDTKPYWISRSKLLRRPVLDDVVAYLYPSDS